MNYEEKIQKQFENFVLKSPSKKPNNLVHLHADFIELKTLFWAQNSWVTTSDIVTHYKDVIEDKNNVDTEGNGTENSNKDDKLNSRVIDVFEFIKEREIIFNENYPFEVEKTYNRIKLKSDLTDKNLIYLKLLLDSNLNNFPEIESILTKEFESLSAIVLQNYLPNAKVKELGSNTDIKGNTITKIDVISKLLNITPNSEEVIKLSKQANKEKGLDLFAYLPFDDEIASMIIILAQCACGKKWDGKKSETESYEAFLNFYKLHPIHSMFIPYGLSSNENVGFHESDKLTNRLVFERKRILDCLTEISFFNSYLSKEITKKCVGFEYIEV